tara:strand:- start:270 stop:1316 length:1047 start_codon:yes stop_codon:yes gene_type:complete
MAQNTPPKLSPREALLLRRQERLDVQKAAQPAMYDTATAAQDKADAKAKGNWFGSFVPSITDFVVGAALNMFLPGAGAVYSSMKPLRTVVKGLTSPSTAKYYGDKAADKVDIPEFEGLLRDYLGDTVSGEKAMRFDRGLSESVDEQTAMQIDQMMDEVDRNSKMRGMVQVGQGLLNMVDFDTFKFKPLYDKDVVKDIRAASDMGISYTDYMAQKGEKAGAIAETVTDGMQTEINAVDAIETVQNLSQESPAAERLIEDIESNITDINKVELGLDENQSILNELEGYLDSTQSVFENFRNPDSNFQPVSNILEDLKQSTNIFRGTNFINNKYGEAGYGRGSSSFFNTNN